MAESKVSIASNSLRLKFERLSAYDEHAKITHKMLLPHEGFPRENNGDWVILEANGERFGTVTFKGHAKRGETWNAPDPEGQSRAQLLVHAVNSQQELLDACKLVIEWYENSGPADPDRESLGSHELWSTCKKAIKKAESGE